MSQPATPGPQALDAEKALLGAALIEAPKVLPYAIRRGIGPKSFSDARHAAIWTSILEVNDAGSAVDPITVSQRLGELGVLTKVGGTMALSAMIDACQTSAHAEHYVKIVENYAQRRQLIDCAARLAAIAHDPELVPSDAGLRMIDEIAQIVRTRDHKTNAEHIDDVIAAWTVKHDAGIRQQQDPNYQVPLSGPSLGFADPDWANERWAGNLSNDDITHWQSCDDILQGLQPGYYLLAGRPSAGKTSFGNNISLNLALAGMPVACCTIDLPARRLLGRSLCNLSENSLAGILKGYVRDEKWQNVLTQAQTLKSLPIHILQNQSGLYEWASWLRLMHAQHGIKLATIDYVQQLRGKTRSQSIDDRMTEVSEVVKQTAIDLNIPILAYAQFNRQSEIDSRPPTIADLRGSGSFEQDAMCAMLLYKLPRYFYDENPLSPWHQKRVRAVICDIAKSQDGETGPVPFWFHCAYFTFRQAPPRFGLTEEEWKLCNNPKLFDEKQNGTTTPAKGKRS